MDWITKGISLFSPSAALKRQKAIAQLGAYNNERKYEGASYGKGTKGWVAVSSSANLENYQAIVTLRNRARDLIRNNAFAKRAKRIIYTNVVGQGIRAKLHGLTKKEAAKVTQKWKDWAETTACDYGGQQTIYGLQAIIMGAVFESGEALVRRRRVRYDPDKPGDVLPIQMQVIEADLLDHNKNYPYGSNFGAKNPDGYVIQGVEFDKNGKIKAYWLFDRHPYELISTSIVSYRVDAADIMHIYKIERPGQVRGVSEIAPVMLKVKHFDDYEYTELVRQKISACFGIFVHDDMDDGTGAVAGTTVNQKDNQLVTRVEPGMIQYLQPGKSVTMSSPPTTDNYEPYTKTLNRSLAAGMNVTYEAMTGDYSNVNFSSGRMGWIEFQRTVEDFQVNVMIPMFCNLALKWFLEGCAMIGVTTNKSITASWIPPRREMIDPYKEVEALSLMVRNGFKSWEEAVTELGEDPEELMAQLVKEDKEFREQELMLVCDPTFDPRRTNAPVEGKAGELKDGSSGGQSSGS